MTAQGVIEPAEPRRTPRHPRSFTWAEFCRGVFLAWGVYQPIGITVGALSMLGSLETPGEVLLSATGIWLVGGVIGSAFVMFIAASGAYGVGMLLRRIRSDAIHITAFFCYGCAIGALVFWVPGAVSGDPIDVFALSWWTDGLVVGAGIAAALGWLISSRIALAADRRLADAHAQSN